MTKVFFLNVSSFLDEAILKKYLVLLPRVGLWQERRLTIQRYKFVKDKALSLGTGLGLLYLIKLYSADPTMLYRTEKGKLYIPGNFFFNVSHAGIYVVFSIGRSENGIDIEKSDIYDIDIAKLFFTWSEYQDILENDARFSRYWTLKESYLKAIGCGLTLPLNSFEIILSNDEKIAYICNCPYTFREFLLDGYHVAVCSKECIDYNISQLTLADICAG